MAEHRRRADADKLAELVELLRHVAREQHRATPTESPGDTDVDRALMLARSIAFRWPADDAPTAKLPPVRERILPPLAPAVRELKGVELLRALADELARDLADEEADS